tara:strand:+ start:71 stop:250 length:180 start_codon:yes stop_codon:yes gene_type:complete
MKENINKIILEVLEDWKDTELNIASEAGREMLANSITDRISLQINSMIEDIVCGAANHE